MREALRAIVFCAAAVSTVLFTLTISVWNESYGENGTLIWKHDAPSGRPFGYVLTAERGTLVYCTNDIDEQYQSDPQGSWPDLALRDDGGPYFSVDRLVHGPWQCHRDVAQTQTVATRNALWAMRPMWLRPPRHGPTVALSVGAVPRRL